MTAVDGVIVSGKHQYAHEDLVGYLDTDVRNQESRPAVGLTRSLSYLVERPLRHEAWHDLLDER